MSWLRGSAIRPGDRASGRCDRIWSVAEKVKHMASADAATRPEHDEASDRARELRKEAFTMALYVSVCLLAALTALSEHADRELFEVLGIVWGTTIGLALAHWFAFRLSARLVESGAMRRRDTEIALAQIVGAVAVAGASTVPIVLFPASAELDAVRFVLAGFICLVAFAVARSHGSGRGRAAAYSASVLAVALTIAIVKNVLSGH